MNEAATLLGRYREARVLSHADVHVALTVQRLGGDPEPWVALAVALCVLGLREGSVCLHVGAQPPLEESIERWIEADDLAIDPAVRSLRAALPRPPLRHWRQTLAASPAVAVEADAPADRPLRLVGDRLYLQRYWQDERLIADEVERRTRRVEVDETRLAAAVDRAFAGRPVDPDSTMDPRKREAGEQVQRQAALSAARGRLTLLAGGPGTGKTTTVATILQSIREATDDVGSIALAAPTGKAAARLQESVAGSLDEPLQASTIHRLLRRRPGSNETFRHHRGNPLPYDLVVVDEMSMVSLPLMARLLDAVREDARLVLVGDPDQLASVEAGAVFGDLVRSRKGRGGLVELTVNFRNEGAIERFSQAVRANEPDAAIAAMREPKGNVTFLPYDASGRPDDARAAAEALVRARAKEQATRLADKAGQGNAQAAFKALTSFRILCGHRQGPYGAEHWNALVHGWIGRPGRTDPWYVGRPVIITENDYATQVFNGETGVVIAQGDRVTVAVDQPGKARLLSPVALAEAETVYAMTVHKSQGSQFQTVAVVLPPAGSPLLTRELLYTAVTRAEKHVLLLGTEEAVREAIAKPALRASGLGADQGDSGQG